ncbi:MAG: hypothetical protein MR446_02280 [Bacteroidales bacterium]|nr:hypothetical protein [Bacteroidales bacterium]
MKFFFPALKIFCQALKKYFQALEKNFHALEFFLKIATALRRALQKDWGVMEERRLVRSANGGRLRGGLFRTPKRRRRA